MIFTGMILSVIAIALGDIAATDLAPASTTPQAAQLMRVGGRSVMALGGVCALLLAGLAVIR